MVMKEIKFISIFSLCMFTLCNSTIAQQEEDVLYRQYCTQNYERIIGNNEKLVDSLENEILKIGDINNLPPFYFDLKFHILVNNNIINDDVVNQQIDILNRSFNTLDEENYIVHENLESFYDLSDVPNFNYCNSSVNSNRFSYIEFDVDEYLFEKLQSLSPIYDEKRVINVYITHLSSNWSGLSTLPHPKNGIDAIVIDYKFFGIHDHNLEEYAQGKTMVHLIGSFLGLYELWSENKNCDDDKVEDTPIHNYANFSAGSEMKNVSTCDGNPIENIVNYMDNLPDMYNVMFTRGQVERLKKVCVADFGRKRYNNNICDQNISNRSIEDQNIIIYPNPNSGLMFIKFRLPLEYVEIKAYNLIGQEVINQKFEKIDGESTISLNTQDLVPGIFSMRIKSDNKIIKQTNFIKN